MAIRWFLAAFLLWSAAPAEPVYALHFQFDRKRPDWLAWYQAEFARAKTMGYTLIVLKFGAGSGAYRLDMGAGSSNGASPRDLRELVHHATETLGLELVLEAKLFGKQRMTMGDLIEKNPGIAFTAKVKGGMGGFNDIWNPRYRCADGRDLYQGVVGPLLDELLSLYGSRRPKYFHMGWDELDKEALVQAARAEGLTPAKLWAREWDRSVRLLLDRGVTPMAWGDCFLSERLAKPGLVAGFRGDPRFLGYKDMNGDPSWTGDASLLEGVDQLHFRDKVVLIDWHYFGGSGADADAFPSVDYFQALGFKDVWIATWFHEKALRSFTRYGKGRGVGGYMATFWNLSVQPDAAERYDAVFARSLPLFKDPDAKLPAPEAWFRRGEAPAWRKTGNRVEAILPGMAAGATLTLEWRPTVRDPWSQRVPLRAVSGVAHAWEHHLSPGELALAPWSDVRLGLSNQGTPPSRWIFGAALEVGPVPVNRIWEGPGALPDYVCAFEGSQPEPGGGFVTGGALRSLAALTDAELAPRGLRLGAKGSVLIPKNAYFWSECRSGIRFEAAFTLDRSPETNAPWEGLVSMGSYNEGVRLLIHEGRLQAQVAGRGEAPLRLIVPRSLPIGKTCRVSFTYDAHGKRAEIWVDGKDEAALESPDFLPLDAGGAFQIYPIAIGAGNAEGSGSTRNPFRSGTLQTVQVWSRPVP
ncbi:MAG: hypothetical protein J0L75_07020 [Spirochaetes bacterium]|nr:hypothetical protein [Spirochaetota bacterium]